MGSRADAFAEAFRERAGSSGVLDAATDATLSDLEEEARRVWPGLEARPEALASALGRAVADGASLDEIDVGELWLALACAAGERAALEAFERRYLDGVVGALRGMGLDDDGVAEALQTARDKLLVSEEGPPRIVGYAGRGRLQALVRVVATRAAIDQRRNADRGADLAGSLGEMVWASADQERAAALSHKGALFRKAFEAAIAQLPAEDRTLLRLHALDAVGIDGIALTLGVHRSTAARRLAKLRATIAADTRGRLRTMGLSPGDLDSVLGIVDEGLELTLSRMLAPADAEARTPPEATGVARTQTGADQGKRRGR